MSRLKPRLTYANVVATLAMVFAMTGGAYAASKFLITSTKQIKPSVLAQLKGKAGRAGAPGAQGPAGPGGAQGPAGAKGENGAPGTNGKDGASVTDTPLNKGNTNCKEGGSELRVDGDTPTFVCNGTSGTTGFTETLPADQSESGTWVSVGAPPYPTLLGGGRGWAPTSISFNIPLKEAPAVHIVTKGTSADKDPSGCQGTVEAPAAEPGNLCIFALQEINVKPEEEGEQGYKLYPAEIPGALTASKRGVVFGAIADNVEEEVNATGVWVVTAK